MPLPCPPEIDGNQQTLRHNGDKQYQILHKPKFTRRCNGIRIPALSRYPVRLQHMFTERTAVRIVQYDNITFLHLFIIYSVRLNLHIHTIRRNLAEKCLLYQSLGKDGTECKYQRILVRTDRSFQILPF